MVLKRDSIKKVISKRIAWRKGCVEMGNIMKERAPKGNIVKETVNKTTTYVRQERIYVEIIRNWIILWFRFMKMQGNFDLIYNFVLSYFRCRNANP